MTLHGMVQWGQNDYVVIDSADVFDDLLTRLQDQAYGYPIMLTVVADDGRSLVLGLGRDTSVLSLEGPDGSLPYFASVGNEDAEGSIWFDYGGQAIEFRMRHAVPFASARKAAVQFLSEPGRPDAVRWEEG